MFTYCDGAGAAISVAVASSATNLVIKDGRLDPRSLRGGEFDSEGIPAGTNATSSPEAAVERLASATGRRVTSVPRLVHPGMGYFAQSSRWLLVLESDAPVRGERTGIHSERRFLVGRSLKTWEQETSRFAEPHSVDTLTLTSGQLAFLHRRPELAYRWDRLSLGGK
jgi:hypothetical protein